MALALFDLDNTLLSDDSDHLWGEFLVQRGEVDAHSYKTRNDAFYQDYVKGQLDVDAYLQFVLEPLVGRAPDELAALHADFMRTMILPIITPAAIALVEQHRAAGDQLVVITATNDFITAPIVRRLGIDTLIASRAEVRDGRYTGRVVGTPCFREGKIACLHEWLATNPFELAEATFYSDSHNDLPLLSAVGHPVAVDPDDTLRAHAQAKGWPIISLL